MEAFDIAIVGPGKVGTALGVLYARSGHRVAAIGGRDPKRTQVAADTVGTGVKACDVIEAASLANWIILAVSDDSIENVCDTIAAKGGFQAEAVVVHCSGALSSTELAAARRLRGCHVGSMHPLQTFPTVEAAIERLPGTDCFYEGDKKACQFITHFARAIGMKQVPILSERKALYHAAAVMACNYLVSLMDAAIEAAGLSGIENKTAWSALEPLVNATLHNVGDLGTTGALTGPIARGDISTVRRHLLALDREAPSLGSLYRELGLRTASIAVSGKSITRQQYAALSDLLSVAGRPRNNT
jgi:predicted short-subunit dehydrogenase-like oxidoreductase (DUF2520 family)